MSILGWPAGYRWKDLPSDLLAGLMGTLSTAPEAMAYALLAGLPAQMGLYSLLLPLLAYFILGTSRELSLAPTATVALLLATTVEPMAGGDPGRSIALATLVTWLVGFVLVSAGAMRLGYVANFVSRPVLDGYFAGAALLISATQLGMLLGLESNGRNLPAIVSNLSASFDTLRPESALLGAGLLALLVLLRTLGLRGFGPPLAVVAGALVVLLSGIDVPVIGSIARGLPPFSLPPLGGGVVRGVLPGVFAMSLLIFLDSASLARHYANRGRYRIDPERELFALGAANLAGGATFSMPVSGNLGDTILLEEAGARTKIVGLVTVALVLLIVLFGADFPNVPLAAFAAIVIHAVLRSPTVSQLRRAWNFDRAEFWLGIICLAGVLYLGLLEGLLLAFALTVLVLLARAARPRVVEVGLVQGAQPALVASDSTPDAVPLVGLLIFQPIGGLFFPSAGPVVDQVRRRAALVSGLRDIIIDLRHAPGIDLTACELLQELAEELGSTGVRLSFIKAGQLVAERLQRAGLGPLLRPPGADLLSLPNLPPGVRDLT